ncbi:MAG TPA: UbiA family prenyltransferase [Methanoregulaceae archaeon]|nr:UbiA family prenyltransferase [Methanoregulaceae archaeon]HOV67187.1 UbiA family prenyltransferase [Methanoregulaceae archaeon]HQJ87903.1 UbiA family prenyltransferase [Methanoregulaceae archaeon]
MCDANHTDNGVRLPAIGFGLRRTVRSVVDFLLFSSTFVGIAGVGMVYTSCLIQRLEPLVPVLAIMMLVPFSVYNMNRKTDEEEDSINRQDRYSFTKRFEKPLFYGALLAYLAAVLIAAIYGPVAILVTLVPLIAGIFYSMPILPSCLGYRRLKEIPVMKNLVVGGSWSLILVFLPVVANGSPVTMETGLCLLFFFTYAFIASSLPDMRDREGDALAGVRTIPVLIGVHRTKGVLGLMNWTTACVVVMLGIAATIPPFIAALYTGAHVYTQCCITSFGRINQHDLICDILSDGQFLIIGLVIFLFQGSILPLI